MAISHKDINLLTQKANIAGTEKIPVSDTEYVTTNQIASLGGGGEFPSSDANKLVYIDSNGDLAASFGVGGSGITYTFSKLQVITGLEGYDYSDFSFIKPGDVNTTLQDVIDDIYNTIGDVETLLNALL